MSRPEIGQPKKPTHPAANSHFNFYFNEEHFQINLRLVKLLFLTNNKSI